GDAAIDRATDARDVHRLPMQQNLAGDAYTPGVAEDAHRELRPTGAHQAGDADDLAATDIQVDVLDRHAVGMDRMMDDPVAHLEHNLPDLGLARRKTILDRPADHRGDDTVLVDIFLL